MSGNQPEILGSVLHTSACPYVQIYDLWPIKIGPFLESGVVPLVLAPIWLLYGYLYPLLDEVFRADAATTEAQDRASSFPTLATTWALAAAQFILSDVLYLADTPHWQVGIQAIQALLL